MDASADFVPAVGDVVEVRWTVVQNEGSAQEFEEVVWWPGQVGDKLPGADGVAKKDDDGNIIRILNYEAYGPFAPEQALVVFTSEHDLKDITEEIEMVWRRRGDSWEPEEADDDQEDEILTAADAYQRTSTELREATGLTTEEEMINLLKSRVPHERLMDGTRAVRSFCDRFHEYIAQLEQVERAQGGELVVTKEMVDNFMATMTTR